MRCLWRAVVIGPLALLLTAGHGSAKDTGMVFVSNEKSSTITVLDPDHHVVDNFAACARPRGMVFTPDRMRFLVGCADDSVIAIYDVATRKLVGRIRDVPRPETFALHPDGRHLYVSNEEDAEVTVYDIETGEQVGDFQTGEEPEGVLATPDRKQVFETSGGANV